KKTWEGFFGGIVLANLIGFLLNNYFYFWDLKTTVFISTILSLFGVLGDLFESAVKRAVGKKDSGALIPGHGGLLDRIDEVLFASPVFLFLLEVFHYGTNP
ncbi:MAG: phosphatidate cytidylyltransferase, partial [Caldimicrobium sp.]